MYVGERTLLGKNSPPDTAGRYLYSRSVGRSAQIGTVRERRPRLRERWLRSTGTEAGDAGADDTE